MKAWDGIPAWVIVRVLDFPSVRPRSARALRVAAALFTYCEADGYIEITDIDLAANEYVEGDVAEIQIQRAIYVLALVGAVTRLGANRYQLHADPPEDRTHASLPPIAQLLIDGPQKPKDIARAMLITVKALQPQLADLVAQGVIEQLYDARLPGRLGNTTLRYTLTNRATAA